MRRTLIPCALVGLLLFAAQPVFAQNGIFYAPKLLTGTTVPDNCTVDFDTRNLGALTLTITGSGTWAAAVSGTDGSGNYTTLQVFDPDDGGSHTSLTTAGTWERSVSGYSTVHVCLTSYVNGSPRVSARTGPGGGGSSAGGGTTDLSTVELNIGATSDAKADVDGPGSTNAHLRRSNVIGAGIAADIADGLSVTETQYVTDGTPLVAQKGVPILFRRNSGTLAPTANCDTNADLCIPALNAFGSIPVSIYLASDGTAATLASDCTHGNSACSSGPMDIVSAVAHGSNPTAVSAGQAVRALANRAGIQWFIGGHPNAIPFEAQIEDADGAQTNAALVTVSGGTKIVVTRASVKCDASNTGPINAAIGFGASTLPARAHTGAVGYVATFDGVPAGSGFVEGNGSGVLGVGADGEDLRLTMEDPAGGACVVNLTYYTIES